ncbi:MAG: DUF2442 domain-containing protein [Gemmatimonadales bacterium]|nr:DUF2442 domain-containing protein [Gemmatimonadales bacterium]MBA3554917.1 DUF2442 domain-containing protein [Gemmatimonadales bacterium]
MTSSVEARSAYAERVTVTNDALSVELSDGRTLSVPLVWHPRLVHETPAERAKWHLIGRGVGIHWPDLDEDVGVLGLLAGRASGESQQSLDRWISRAALPPKQHAADS